MRLWYLSHRRPAKVQARLRIRADSPDPSLFAHKESKKTRNDQELIQSDPTSCPQNQKGNNYKHKLTAVYERHSR